MAWAINRGQLGLSLVLALACLFVILIASPPAAAAPYTVSTNSDGVNNANCLPGNCTLRQAFNAASAATDADTISVPPGDYLLTPGFGPITLNNTTATVTGAGSVATSVSGQNVTRVMSITNTADVTLQALAIVDGTDFEFAGGIYAPGTTTVSLENVLVSGNQAQMSAGNYGFGGGITKGGGGTLTLTNSQVSGNIAHAGSFFGGAGGGIQSSGPATLTNSIVSGNQALGASGSGGGISMNGSVTLTLTDSTISGNLAGPSGGSSSGGGIFAASATVVANQSTISDNTAGGPTGDGTGGGIRVNGGNLMLTNSTVSGNRAFGTSTQGGGTKVNGGMTILTSSTIADNSAGSGPSSDGGNVQANGGSIALNNSIVSGGVATNGSNCQVSGATFSNTGRNLESADTCSLAAGDLKNTNPQLGPLAGNGGPTPTRALAATSPAIDQAIGCPPPATDQRGVARPVQSACDLGAFEFVPPPSSSIDNIAPGASGLTFKPTSFRALTKGPTIAAKKKKRAKLGSSVSYRLTEAATTSFTVQLKVKGRKQGKRCATKRKRGKRCTKLKTIGRAFTHKGVQGSNSFKFSGRMSSKKLKRGSYRMTGIPQDAAGNKGRPVVANFRIVR